MTWVKGATTWANLIPKLTQLICGETADDSSVSVASGQRWIREIGGQDMLRAPASQDVALGNMSNRSGYWTLPQMSFLTGSPQVNVPTPVPYACRQTTIQTAVPNTAYVPNGRWWITIVVISAQNAVANNYSDLACYVYAYDADAATVNYGTSSFTGSVYSSVSAGGVLTLSSAMGNGTVTLSSPTGFIPSGTSWYRGFTSAYMGGIDYWPHYGKRSGTHAFSVNPSGTTVTDWDVVDIPTGYYKYHTGLGIKTNTGLSGNKYTVSWSIGMKIRMVALSGASNGIVNLELFSGGKVDTVYQNPTFRTWGEGFTASAWLRPFAIPGSVDPTAPIQYWMSVTATKIAVVLNADPGYSGKLTCAWVGKFTPYYPTWDIFPWFTGYTQGPSGAAASYIFSYLNLNQYKWRKEDISAVRDWQTGWMRNDTFSTVTGGDSYGQQGSTLGVAWVLYYVMAEPNYYVGLPTMLPARSNKPSTWDGKWWLHGVALSDRYSSYSNASINTGAQVDDQVMRGYIDQTAGCLYIPGTGWAAGDELTDTVTGNKWFLVEADYHGIWFRYYTSSTPVLAGGAAILEE